MPRVSIDADRRRFDDLRREVRDVLKAWHGDGRISLQCDNWARGFDPAFSKALAEHGLLGLTWPVRFGGRGLSNMARLVVTEELLRWGAPVAAHWVGDRQIGPAIIRYGSPRLQEELLPGIISADFLFCLGMSEPEAGSDLASLTTRATKVDGGWRLSGRKTWTSGAHNATHMYVLARTTAGSRKHDGLTEFLLEMGTSGIHVSPVLDLTGEHHFNEVTLEDVFVPDDRVLGVVDDGWAQVTSQLAYERGGPERFLATYPLLRELMTCSRGSAESDLKDLGVLVARLGTLRELAAFVASELDSGRAPVEEAAMLKYLGSVFEHDVIASAREHYSRSGQPPSTTYRTALLSSPGFGIRGGAAEVLLSLIAKRSTR